MSWLKKIKGASFEGTLGTVKKLLEVYIDDLIELRAKEKVYREMLDRLHDKEVEAKHQEVVEELAHRRKVLEGAATWFEKAAKQIREVLNE